MIGCNVKDNTLDKKDVNLVCNVTRLIPANSITLIIKENVNMVNSVQTNFVCLITKN